jgi:hypothetical protein
MKNQEEESKEASEIRRVLGNLQKEKAPWYFEAQLRQRIAEESKARPSYLLRPALALPIIAALGAFVFYLSVPDLGERLNRIYVDPEISLPNPFDPDAPPVKRPRSRPRPVENESSDFQQNDTQRGPSSTLSDPFIPSTTLTPDGGEGAVLALPLAAESTDTITPETTQSDSADTLGIADSLQR